MARNETVAGGGAERENRRNGETAANCSRIQTCRNGRGTRERRVAGRKNAKQVQAEGNDGSVR